jgi:microcystin-dependent protein
LPHSTPNRGLPYPDENTDAPDGAAQIQALADALDLTAFVMQGSRASRPSAAANPFTFYYGTDVHSLWFSDGANWQAVGDQTGDVKWVPHATVDPGWLLADGSSISASGVTADLRTKIGANLPDLRGRVPVGVDGSAGRLSVNDALGQSGGEEKHTLTVPEMPAHTHPPGVAATSFILTGPNTPWTTGGSNGIQGSTATGSTGGDGAHNNMPPYLVGNWLIKL